jgi:hypothetical protein
MGARVAFSGDHVLEPPFVLHEDTALKHVFAYTDSDRVVGYGVVAGNAEQQLNMGSLVCRE